MRNVTIYIEKEIQDHFRTQEVLRKFVNPRVICIERYSHVFNRKNQNFTKQKQHGKTFILAKKRRNFVLENPDHCISDADMNFYFSHVYNCPFDCEYCYLQGMYRSAFFAIFVNYEDFCDEIEEEILKNKGKTMTFFTGYDADSLALEHITGFAEYFVPWFDQFENVHMELRSKSVNIDVLKNMEISKNTLVTWTISPQEIQEQWEKGTPSIESRLKALAQVQKMGWKTGVRIEPILFHKGWEQSYTTLLSQMNKIIDFSRLENIFLGTFRMPKDMFKKLSKMKPRSTLFTKNFVLKDGRSYVDSKELPGAPVVVDGIIAQRSTEGSGGVGPSSNHLKFLKNICKNYIDERKIYLYE